jgi:hypothetical protein
MKDDKFHKPGDAAGRLAELRAGKKPAASATEVELTEAEELSDSGGDSFSTLSADRNQKMMLELRFKTNDAVAFPYSFLVRAKFDPSKEIVLDFSIVEVRIAGRNLRTVYSAIVAQRAAHVQETDELYAEVEGATAATVVTRIEVKERKE